MEDQRCPICEELRKENTQLKNRVAELEQQVAELQAKVDKLTKMLFGKKSEKSKKKDQDADDTAEEQTSEVVASDAAPKKPRKRGGGGRKPFPPEIPRRDVHVALHRQRLALFFYSSPTSCRRASSSTYRPSLATRRLVAPVV